MRLRSMPRLAAPCVLALVACSSHDDAAPPAAASPYDDDTARLAHCTIESPPARATLPPQAPGAIRAGISSAVLDLPIGTPLGGYTARAESLRNAKPVDARARRWADGFTPSAGVHDAPRAEALALDVAGERWVLVRIDAPLVNAHTLYDVESAVAPDGSMRGRIMFSASHSHAAWAAWQPTWWLSPGVDHPRKDLYDRAVASIARAASEAIAALEPARLGIAVDSAFDPTDSVTHDRRPENNDVLGPDGNTAGKGKDPYVWVMRVDRADGSPLAAVVDVAIHGTVGDEDNPLASTDAPGAIERALASELGYPVLHLQGATGDIAPSGPPGRAKCPDGPHCLDIPRLEVVGARAASFVAPIARGIRTSATAAMEVVARPSYVGHAGIVHRPDGTTNWYIPPDNDYEPDGIIEDAAGRIVSPVDEFNAPGGAGLCGNLASGSIAGIPATNGMGAYSSCVSLVRGGDIILGVFDIPHEQTPFCDTVRLQTTAVRIAGLSNGDWLILGIPGEPTAPFASYLRGQSPAGRDHTLLVGYEDYGGYMLTAEDWLAGGYETSVNLWGPLEGEMVIDGLLKAAAIAWTPEREDPEAGTTRVSGWQFPGGDRAVTVGTTSDHGTIATSATPMLWPDTVDAATPMQPPASVPRVVGAARFAWYGGDPAVDFPEVVVERMDGGAFVPLLDARRRAASSYDGAVVVTYTPSPIDAAAPAHHVYGATWQPVPPDAYSLAAPARAYSLPAGRYRLHAKGRAMTSGGAATYDVASAAFDVVAAPLSAKSSAARASAGVAVQALLDPAPGLRALRDMVSDVDLALPGPWNVTVTLDDATTRAATATPDAAGNATVPLAAGDAAHAVSIEVRDQFGNGGVLKIP